VTSDLPALAGTLRALHRPGSPLVLRNAWDAASARTLAEGAPAVATTSVGVAEALGYGDGGHLPAAEALASLARIVAAVDVPVTADCEAGYGLEPEAFVEGLLTAGAVGCNLEDTDHDVHVRGGTLEDGLVRAVAYRDAGADCVYPIFCHDEAGIAAYVEAAAVVNVHVHAEAPSLTRMAELGVARASYGGSLFRAALRAAATYEP
jgi:2-methylisocitrate lyase-like PEP mutase family enzyme